MTQQNQREEFSLKKKKKDTFFVLCLQLANITWELFLFYQQTKAEQVMFSLQPRK